MSSVIFRTGANLVLPVMLLLSLIVLLRGHNEPGGGFVGGLLASAGFALSTLAHSSTHVRRMLRVTPHTLISAGLLTATLSGVPAMFNGLPYLEGLWVSLSVPGFSDPIKLGTPLVFDIGVYLLVLGGVMLMVLTLEEVPDGAAARD